MRLISQTRPMASEDTELKRLRWRCRRGMRELDQLTLRYLDQAWALDSEAQRGVFLRLLDTEDDKLWRWFMGYDFPADAEIAALIERIRQLPP
jgi:antitoxin CptB